MVYNCLDPLLPLLQRHCLLCLCPMDKQSPVYGLCSYCLAAMPRPRFSCSQCGLPLASDENRCGACIQHPPAFDYTVFCTHFNPYVQHLVMRLKKQHDNASCRLMADWLSLSVQESTLPNIDALIAVPMHWQRNLWRGNNHSTLLAKRLAQRLDLPFYAKAVKKTRNTLPQRSLTARQRKRNLRGAFAAQENLTDLHIGIVDDVMTTASTMEAIARALKKAGAAKVSALVIARA